MGKRFIYLNLLLIILSTDVCDIVGQSLTSTPNPIVFPAINNKATYTNGTNITGTLTSSSNISLGILGSNIAMTVNATTPSFSDGNNHEIPLNDVSIVVTNANVGLSLLSSTTKPTIQLSTDPKSVLTVSTGLGISLAPITINLEYTLAGGTDLLKPAGTYSTTLHFVLTISTINVLGASILAQTFTGDIPIQIVITPSCSISVQSTSTLNFSTVSDYVNGVSLTQANALNVFGTPSYAVSVQASGNLKNGDYSIGIGNIYLTPTATSSLPSSDVSVFPVALSQSPQPPIITSSTPTLSQDFDLTYSTQPGNSSFLNLPAGTYITQLTYTITAP